VIREEKDESTAKGVEMSEQKQMNRRDFLKAAAGAAGAAGIMGLAACQPQTVIVKETVEVEKEVLVTQVVEVEKEVTKIVAGTPVVEKVVETQIVEKEVTRVVEVEKEAEVQGTFFMLQKKDYHPTFNEWFRQAMVDWCKERGWPLDISYVAGYTGGTPEIEKIIASVEAGQPADLIMHNLGITQLRQARALEAVSPIVDEIEAQWGSTTARNRNDMFTDEQWWAVPYFQRSDGGWYQEPVFEAGGYDMSSVRQYNDLWEACLDVSDPDNGLYGWGVTINRCGDGDWFMNRVTHGWGAYYQDETGQYVTVDSPEMVEAMTAMTELYMDDKWAPMLPPGVLAWTDGSNNEAYLAGQVAYTQNGGTVYAKSVIDNNPIKDVTRFHAPAGGPVNEEFNSLSSNRWMILRGARNYDAAKTTLLEFMLNLEKQDGVFAASPAFSLPAYEGLWDASEYIPTNPVAQDQKAVALDKAGVVPYDYPGPSLNPAMVAADSAGIMNDMVADILRGTPVAEAVATCHERFVQIFQEFGLPGEMEG
jgi:multiple sugar transport system substrate-binding protein